jgi:hypothetical protein
MESQKRVLWIEDSARYELSELAGPVYASHKYWLHIAENATAATQYMRNNEYDVLIVDMRLPPGGDPVWQDIYRKEGKNKDLTHLGAHLLQWLLNGKSNGVEGLGEPPTWVTADRVAVFTVEGRDQLDHILDKMNLTYEQKRATRRDTILLDLIDRVVKNSKNGSVKQ